MRGLIGTIFFSLFLLLGYSLCTSAWNGRVYVYLGDQRAPAAVRTLKDYTALDRKALTRDAQTQLISSAQVQRVEGQLAISFGHPVVTLPTGTKGFACGVKNHPGIYNRVQVTFWGVGIAESGEAPKMTVETVCQSSDEVDVLQTIWVPMEDILSAQPQDQELQVMGSEPISIKLEHIPSQWPDSWALHEVRLFQDGLVQDEIQVGPEKFNRAPAGVIKFNWNNP